MTEPVNNRILVVDDDPQIVAMLELRLGHAGFDVTGCSDACQALLLAKGLQPALVITDFSMPLWGTGLDAYQSIRNTPELKDTPVIFLTAVDPEQAKSQLPVTESSRLLFKPVDWLLLEDAIQELTGRRCRLTQ